MIRSFILGPVLRAINRMEGKLMAAIDDLTNEVTEATDVMGSAALLISGLKQQLDEAIAKLEQGDNGEALNALSQQLDQGANALAAAITANTPAEQGGEAPAPAPAPQEPGTEGEARITSRRFAPNGNPIP